MLRDAVIVRKVSIFHPVFAQRHLPIFRINVYYVCKGSQVSRKSNNVRQFKLLWGQNKGESTPYSTSTTQGRN